MGNDRLNGLALMSVHYDLVLDKEAILDMFVAKQPRRLELLY